MALLLTSQSFVDYDPSAELSDESDYSPAPEIPGLSSLDRLPLRLYRGVDVAQTEQRDREKAQRGAEARAKQLRRKQEEDLIRSKYARLVE